MWSHQVESEYSEKFAEKLPSDWVEKLENINQIKVETPVPNSVRYRELYIAEHTMKHFIIQGDCLPYSDRFHVQSASTAKHSRR